MAHVKGLEGAAPLLGLLPALTGACSGGATPHENDGGSAGRGGEPPTGSAGRDGAAQAGAAAGGSAKAGNHAGGSEQGGGDAGGTGGATKFDPTDLQLNDVSVLFPLPKTEQEFLPDPKLIPEAELEATFDNQEPLTNVHAFSYTRTGVGINQRAVNESAAVVEYLSKQTCPGQP